MNLRWCLLAALAVGMGLVMPGCGKEKAANKGATITVWDYYGKEVSPLVPLVEAFQKEHPEITVKREDLDWETMHTKLNVVLSSGNVPDLVTIDMTWLPTYADLGVFTDLKALSGGTLNGKPFDEAWAPRALASMKHGDKTIAALYDFDAYALYYRSDLLAAKGLKAPATWDDLVKVGKAIATKDKNLYGFVEDTFHTAQFIYENQGSILNADHTAAAFTSEESVEAMQFYTDLVRKHKIAMDWTQDQGEIIQGVKDGRIAMWADGPYRMGQLRESVPELAGKWAIAPHPFRKQAASYLGGTGLCIPAKSAHQEAAWLFAQFLMRPENAVQVYTKAGAAPALLAALERPEVNAPDPYFGGQKPMEVFRLALDSAIAFPKIRRWEDVDVALTEATRRIVSGGSPVQESLAEAAKTVDKSLKD